MKELNLLENNFTQKEIKQQPVVWKKVVDSIFNNKQKYTDFFVKHDIKNRTIYISGAGSSDYAAQIAAIQIRTYGYDAIALPTTDFVTDPHSFVSASKKYCLVSLARSGQSPESIGTSAIFKKLDPTLVQIFITPNAESALYKLTGPNDIALHLPSEAHDKSFAMTSSFTSLALSSILIFCVGTNESILDDRTKAFVEEAIPNIVDSVNSRIEEINRIVSFDFDRYVVLGSNINREFAKEGALKMLELCSGKVATMSESIMGFRHGPKSITTDKTLVVFIRSEGNFVRRFEADLIIEMKSHYPNNKFVELDFNGKTNFINGLFAIVYLQILATNKSISIGLNPDNPFPDGSVNRVVKGVTIYE